MNQFDRELRQMAAKEKIVMPVSVQEKVEATLSTLPRIEKAPQKQFRPRPKIAVAAACLAFVLLFVMPNVSVAYAQSMEKIPIIGDLIHVVTIRNYFYSDRNHELDVDVPNISNSTDGSAAEHINQDVDALTQKLVDQFYSEVKGIGAEGHSSLYTDYVVQTNTPRWFTLKLSVHIVAGSGTSYFKYYHIDRASGEIIQLSDLFTTPDFNKIITENIKEQMRQRMAEDSKQVYFMKTAGFGFEFANVDPAHNFYFNDDGDLVIPFDKYEVAPGSMGCPEFVIEKDVIHDILKDEYKDIFS